MSWEKGLQGLPKEPESACSTAISDHRLQYLLISLLLVKALVSLLNGNIWSELSMLADKIVKALVRLPRKIHFPMEHLILWHFHTWVTLHRKRLLTKQIHFQGRSFWPESICFPSQRRLFLKEGKKLLPLSGETTIRTFCLPSEKRLLLKERICSPWEQILSFTSSPLFRRELCTSNGILLYRWSLPLKGMQKNPKTSALIALCIHYFMRTVKVWLNPTRVVIFHQQIPLYLQAACKKWRNYHITQKFSTRLNLYHSLG